MKFIPKRLLCIFSLTVVFSMVQGITRPNASNANPYDNLGLYRDYDNLKYSGLSCRELREKGDQASRDASYWGNRANDSVNSDNEYLYRTNQSESLRLSNGYYEEYLRKECKT